MENEFFDLVKGFAKKQFLENGTITTACFMMLDEGVNPPPFMIKNGNLVYLPIPLDKSTDKNVIADLIRYISVVLKAKALSFVTEAWMVIANHDDNISKIIPSKDPARRECILIGNETKTIIQSVMIPIIRNGNEVNLGEETITHDVSGRFANLMRR